MESMNIHKNKIHGKPLEDQLTINKIVENCNDIQTNRSNAPLLENSLFSPRTQDSVSLKE